MVQGMMKRWVAVTGLTGYRNRHTNAADSAEVLVHHLLALERTLDLEQASEGDIVPPR